ncbi:MAG: sigma-54-dependent Fis family transcriptional regulator [Pseudomonadota bacterium]|nr:sigma-54-dependent Fis family transcriptional regulator [Pseudomonadota bacterium]
MHHASAHDHLNKHARFVQSVVNGKTNNGIERQIARSWQRCLTEHHLDPAGAHEPVLIERTELLKRQEQAARLLDVARLEMANLYQQVAGSGYAILLADPDGVVLNYIGDPQFTSAAARSGMQNGAVWNELTQGTNGMGTCLIEKKPLVVHHNEHFFAGNTFLTCSAAPIFSPQDELLAVLNASGESSMAQQHTKVLVKMSAQLIENRIFLCAYKDRFLVRFHSRPEFVSILGEGVLAFDGEGRVQGANHSAVVQLGAESKGRLIGRRIEDIFSLSMNSLCNLAVRHAFHPVPIHDANNGRRFFAAIQSPELSARSYRPFSRSSGKKRDADDSTGDHFHGLEFGDARMADNIRRARKIIGRGIPTILYGETGTGKGLFAKALHLASRRAAKPFVVVNCAAIPETLIESELFGYRPGAFTGARREGSRGKILQANGGTLFLDEIGDMPPQLQARLLRVLEDKEVVPLGGEAPIKVDVHVISATHCNLVKLIVEGKFREDLYYRLHGISLSMPALRNRGDKHRLIEQLMKLEAGRRSAIKIESDAMKALENYDWPGNIRQLRNSLRTSLALCEGDTIMLDDLDQELRVGGQFAPAQICMLDDDDAREENPLACAEREAILSELEALRWNVTKVAAKLSLSRNTLYRKMRRYGIKPPR